MIKTLDRLTIGQFIDLVCGDTGVLASKHEIVSETELTAAMREIVFQYKSIADPAGAKSYLGSSGDMAKARLELAVFTACQNLVNLNEYDRAREIMEAAGINVASMSEQRLSAEVKSRLARAEYSIRRMTEERQTTDKTEPDIRRMFDEQTAALMAFFRFQIDTSRMKATEYAHLVARQGREIKAQKAALHK